MAIPLTRANRLAAMRDSDERITSIFTPFLRDPLRFTYALVIIMTCQYLSDGCFLCLFLDLGADSISSGTVEPLNSFTAQEGESEAFGVGNGQVTTSYWLVVDIEGQ